MLGSLLGGHGTVCVTPETQFLVPLLLARPRAPAEEVEAILGHFKFRTWEFTPDRGRLIAAAAEGRPALVRDLVAQYGASVGVAPVAAWVDHTPSNMANAPILLERFPGSKFVHIVRDGRAVAASLLSQSWGPSDILSAAEYWIRQVGVAHSVATDLGAPTVRYEDLVREPERVATLCAELELPHAAESVGGGFVEKPKFIDSTHALVGKPPDPSRIEGWRERLTEREIELFEWRAWPMLHAFGYELDFGSRAGGAGRSERALINLRGGATRIKKWVRRLDKRRRYLGWRDGLRSA